VLTLTGRRARTATMSALPSSVTIASVGWWSVQYTSLGSYPGVKWFTALSGRAREIRHFRRMPMRVDEYRRADGQRAPPCEAPKRDGHRPFPLPVAVLLKEEDGKSLHVSACVRCNAVDGYPCLVNG
jgi:hypothetical protein